MVFIYVEKGLKEIGREREREKRIGWKILFIFRIYYMKSRGNGLK